MLIARYTNKLRYRLNEFISSGLVADGVAHCLITIHYHYKSYNYHLELLSPVALGAVPLHNGLPQIQQEYISIVEAAP